MKKFKISDMVVALTNTKGPQGQPRIKGQIYTVLGILYCSGCGEQAIDISHTPAPYNMVNARCSCGNRQSSPPHMYTLSENFALVSPESLEDAAAEQNYELAALIRDNI